MGSILRLFLALTLALGASEAAGAANSWTIPGTLRVAMGSQPNTLNPVIRTQLIETWLGQLCLDGLIEARADGKNVPKLASEVPTLANGGISKDGLKITYHLRHNVKWHDGVPFTSKDVAFSFHTIMNPNTNVQDREGYSQVARLDTPDPYTVVVHLKARYAPFVTTFFQPTMVLPEHLLRDVPDINKAEFNAAPIGTGPFKFVRWQRGVSVEFAANDDYYLGKPGIRKIVVRSIPDENTVNTMMRSHEIDWFWGASPTAMRNLGTDPSHAIVMLRRNAFYGITINMRNKPLDDRRVRQAISMGIDRDFIADRIGNGAVDAAAGDIPSFMWAYDPKLPKPHLDLDGARALLRAAGFTQASDGYVQKDGKRLTLVFTYGAGGSTGAAVSLQVQAMLKVIGIDIVIKPIDPNQLFAPWANNGVLSRGNFDLNWSGFFQLADPDNSRTLTCENRPPQGFNYSYFCNPEFETAQHAATQSYDREVRKRAYARIEAIVLREVPEVYIWWPRLIHIVNTDFTGLEESPGQEEMYRHRWKI